jgi:hypothetical protein
VRWGMSMNQFLIVPPTRSRKSWDVHAFNARGRWLAAWYCDSKSIAKLVQKRLRSGKAPGWAGLDDRKGMKS